MKNILEGKYNDNVHVGSNLGILTPRKSTVPSPRHSSPKHQRSSNGPKRSSSPIRSSLSPRKHNKSSGGAFTNRNPNYPLSQSTKSEQHITLNEELNSVHSVNPNLMNSLKGDLRGIYRQHFNGLEVSVSLSIFPSVSVSNKTNYMSYICHVIYITVYSACRPLGNRG